MAASDDTNNKKTKSSISEPLDRQALWEKPKAELVDLLLDALAANQAQAETERYRQNLAEAIDALDDAFVLYDPDGNLVLANKKFKETYAFNAPFLVPGTSFEDLFRNEIREGIHPGVTLEDHDFIAERVARFLEGRESATRSYSGNRWMLVTDRRTPSGQIVGLRTDITELKHREEEAELAKKAAEKLARTDALTGLNNRRAFFEQAGAVDAQARRYSHPYVFAMIDIDHFKSINDTWGHKTGDVVLKAVSDAVAGTLRETDILGRIGGEEFAVMLPETVLDEGRLLAERVRSKVEETVVQAMGNAIDVTASIGVAAFTGLDANLDEVLSNADKALYQAKDSGRNAVVCHTG